MPKPNYALPARAVLGQTLPRNVPHNAFPIAVHTRTAEKTHEFLKEHGSEGEFTSADDIPGFVSALEPPRAIMIMVKAGKPVDEVISSITPHLENGDLLIDGGNSLFTDTERRITELAPKGIHFLATGVSAAEQGA